MRRSYKHRIRPGGYAWIGLAGGVFLADLILIQSGQDTMSEVFGGALKHPVKRWPVSVAWVVLTLHLFGNLLPRIASPIKRFDPIGAVARLLTPRV